MRIRIRKPTRKEKEKMSKAGLDWKEWNVVQGMGEDGRLAIVNKWLGSYKTIDG